MKVTVPLTAILSVFMMGTGVAAGENDAFHERRVLPSQESVEEPIFQTTRISYEALDPVLREDNDPGPELKEGTLWWEWTAPRDGWFSARGFMAEGSLLLETYVFTGDRLENLLPVLNGNVLGLSQQGTLFEARQGRKYNIVVRFLGMPVIPDPAFPVVAYLRLKPAPGIPANDTLERRLVLSGSSTAVKSTNLTVSSKEDSLLTRMALLYSAYGQPYDFGATQWWEWTCPETGRYDIGVQEMNPVILGGARKVLPGGGNAPAGEWDNGDMEIESSTFYAIAGRTYDFAVTTPPSYDFNDTDTFGEYTLRLSRRTPAALPPNVSPETAAVMPSTLHSTVSFLWGGRPSEDNDLQLVLWWRFTAPEKGIYRFDALYPAKLRFEPGTHHSAYNVPLLAAGETVLIECTIPEEEPSQVHLGFHLLGVPGNNDMLAQATDLGSAQDFFLYGQGTAATIEDGEVVPLVFPPNPGARLGSLWWKWTAPGAGWLRVVDEVYSAPLTVDTVGTPAVPREYLASIMKVAAGRTYLIRAGLTDQFNSEACVMHLDFMPEPSNLTWQTARDLGLTASPAWNPPYRFPEASISGRPWFRWTALEDGELSPPPDKEIGDVYEDPAVGLQIMQKPVTMTYSVQAGKTYWLRSNSMTSYPWFELTPARVTTNGNPSTAMPIPADLPAAATAVCRGDLNSEDELALLEPFVGQSVRFGMPIIWWRWEPQKTERVRVRIEGLGRSGTPVVFSGPVPVADVEFVNGQRDWGSLYFKAEAGRIYWLAIAADTGTGIQNAAYRAEIWPVADVAPPNDNFSASRKISALEWEDRQFLTVANYGVPGGWNPVRWEWTSATMEAGEPPLAPILDAEGNPLEQSATTWWNWTAPLSSIYVFRVTTRTDGMRNVRGGSDPYTPLNLSASVFTGDSLESLQPVKTIEPRHGWYCFRAQQGVRYNIRVATAKKLAYYDLNSIIPGLEDIYDFAAVEEGRLEDVGTAWDSYAGDDVPNARKFLFGLDPHVSMDHPRNASKLSRLPHVVPGPPGFLEMRCEPDRTFLVEGNPVWFLPYGESSGDLQNWQQVQPATLSNGEVAIRLAHDARTGFLRWRVLKSPWE